MRTAMFTKKQGFTLIEIIIVVVILGILAAIALPKLTANIDKARAAEAFNIGGDIGKAFDRCLADETGGAAAATAANVANCDSFAELSITDPSTTSGNFSYSLTSGGTVLRMLATMKTSVGGIATSDLVDFSYNGVTGATTKGCGPATGKLNKMCKS